MGFVLVNDSDTVVKPDGCAELVKQVGVKAAAAEYGISEGKLRQYLNQNGWHGKRSTAWVKDQPEALTDEIPVVPVPDGDLEGPPF
jgi:hypothetical protein